LDIPAFFLQILDEALRFFLGETCVSEEKLIEGIGEDTKTHNATQVNRDTLTLLLL